MRVSSKVTWSEKFIPTELATDVQASSWVNTRYKSKLITWDHLYGFIAAPKQFRELGVSAFPLRVV